MKSIKPDFNSHISNKRSQADAFIQIRINRNVFIAVIVSVLIHILALFILGHKLKQKPFIDISQPLEVGLVSPTLHQQAEAAPLAEPPKPLPEVKPIQKPKVKSTTKPISPTHVPQPSLTKPIIPVTPVPAASPNASPTDMMSDIKARQRRREAEEGYTESENATAPTTERRPSEDEIRTANINRNLQAQGTNGIFRILSMDDRTATFSFRGWRSELSYSHSETYKVDAPIGGDLRREVIRKMIEIIRRYYTGDFNWDSYRLQRVVVLSARPEDTAGLEDFMMKEFFRPE